VNIERNLTLKPCVRGLAAILIAVLSLVGVGCREEGGGVVVRHLGFEGVRLVSEADLRLAVTLSGSSALPWGQKTFFSKQEFDDDLRRLESFYVSRGFPDARVTSFRTTYNKARTEIDLVVIIDEGAPVVIDGVEFVGFEPLPQGHVVSLRERAALVPGAPRDQERVEVVRGMALGRTADHGFPTASVSLSERPGTRPRSVVTFTALPGPFATFGNVVISGNGGVKRDVIDRQLAFKRGAVR
jgi:outer membrane protein insertion porin family